MNSLRQPQNNWVELATVSEYLKDAYTPSDTIQVERGSWGVGGANIGLSTWEGSALHKEMWARVARVRQQFLDLQAGAGEAQKAEAWNYFAMAETSCYWFWNNRDWAQKSADALDLAVRAMQRRPARPMAKIDAGSPAFGQLEQAAAAAR